MAKPPALFLPCEHKATPGATQVVGQPAAWTVPLAFAVMVAGSLLTGRRVPGDIGATMLRLHAPESLRL